FYDVLHLADGTDIPIKVKSLVGLVPVSAALAYDGLNPDLLPDFQARANWFMSNHPEYMPLFHMRDIAGKRHRLLALVPPERLIRLPDSVREEKGLLAGFRRRGG